LIVFCLLAATAFGQKGHSETLWAPRDVFQGDLVLTGNNVTTIEGRFDVNGSIIVEENATLILNNAVLNFTQTESYQFHMTFQNPTNGNPRLIVENATITSNKPYMRIYFLGNSSATLNRLSTNFDIFMQISSSISFTESTTERIYTQHFSALTASNSSFVFLSSSDSSSVLISNCTINVMACEENSNFEVSDSEITSHVETSIGDGSYTVAGLKPGFVRYWNFVLNCSAAITPGGWAPNATLTNTQVAGWGFLTKGSSKATISDSQLWALWTYDVATAHVNRSTVTQNLESHQSSSIHISETTTHRLFSYHNSRLWLVNSTSDIYDINGQSRVYVSWYLNVHVVDETSQDVPSANVNATFSNGTLAESRQTDTDGWTRLTLFEKTKNATGDYPVGNYTVEAAYLSFASSTTTNLTTNQVITLRLEGFIIPEFPSSTLALPFIAVTLLLTAALAYRKKHSLECLHA